jgi:hypothetical protein
MGVICSRNSHSAPELFPRSPKPYFRKEITDIVGQHTLTNVIYVEQPVGTGFTTGKATITSEEELATQFMGFWKNFIDTFGMHGYKVYISGESYA